MTVSAEELAPEIQEQSERLGRLRQEVAKVIVGQEYLIDRLIIGMLSNGHVLLEGVPGLGKTMLVRTLGEAVDVRGLVDPRPVRRDRMSGMVVAHDEDDVRRPLRRRSAHQLVTVSMSSRVPNPVAPLERHDSSPSTFIGPAMSR